MKTIADLENHIVAECTPVDMEAAFAEYLDSEGPVEVRGLSMMPSSIWKECDPTAFRCGVNDFADGEPWTEIQGETYAVEDIEKAREEFVDELRDELSSLEDELSEFEEDDQSDEAMRLRCDVVALESFIAECERHAF